MVGGTAFDMFIVTGVPAQYKHANYHLADKFFTEVEYYFVKCWLKLGGFSEKYLISNTPFG